MRFFKPRRVIFLLIVVGLIYWQFSREVVIPEIPYDVNDLHGPYQVERVVDGDTLIALVDGNRERIRLIGIDAPESVPDNPDRVTEEGLVAADYTKQLLNKATIYLEYDQELRDQYDRLLAYAYLKDGSEYVMINYLLVEEGYAEPYTVRPNTKYELYIKEAAK